MGCSLFSHFIKMQIVILQIYYLFISILLVVPYYQSLDFTEVAAPQIQFPSTAVDIETGIAESMFRKDSIDPEVRIIGSLETLLQGYFGILCQPSRHLRRFHFQERVPSE